MASNPGNTPEYSVSEIAGAVKRTVEQAFGQVRVRGELSQFKRFASGHWYGRVKDERAVLEIVMWKGAAAAMRFRPEDGMEVIAVGKLTTYPGSSKYQLVVERLEPAGVGALLAQLEARREALRAEGLFARERKKPLPYLPEHIGVITSPTGAVIRDILHRLADRFPRRVTLWPVTVQGDGAAAQIAAAIRGMNALAGAERPDVLIVARGGGSVEDLWAFNEEVVVRAAAASAIPLISAVGHETDTTLIDYAADRRAPTPTAAAEMAVPVRAELLEAVAGLGLRLASGERRGRAAAKERLRGLRLPRPAALVALPRQRLDDAGERLPRGLSGVAQRRRAGLERTAVRLRPGLLGAQAVEARAALGRAGRDASRGLAAVLRAARAGLARPAASPNAALLGALARSRRARLAVAGERLPLTLAARARAGRARLDRPAATPGLGALVQRLAAARAAVASAFRLAESLGPAATLARGYAIVTDAQGAVVKSADAARAARRVRLRFADGTADARTGAVDASGGAPPSAQGRLI